MINFIKSVLVGAGILVAVIGGSLLILLVTIALFGGVAGGALIALVLGAIPAFVVGDVVRWEWKNRAWRNRGY